MTTLIVLNDPPYGTERSYDGLRLALQLAKQEGVDVRVFLMADAVACARTGQTTPTGYHNLEPMLRGVLKRGGAIGACGTCMDARGFADPDLLDDVHRSTMDELGRWTLEADRTINLLAPAPNARANHRAPVDRLPKNHRSPAVASQA